MVVCRKKQKQCLPDELEAGDCWIGLSLAKSSGLILAARVGKHTDALIEELVVSTEGKTNCKQWNSDDWGGYERVLPPLRKLSLINYKNFVNVGKAFFFLNGIKFNYWALIQHH